MDNGIREFIFKKKHEFLLFHLLNEKEVEQILDYFEIVLYPKGTLLFSEGECGDFIGFIISGIVEIKKQTEFKGKEVVIATLKKDSYVGEMSLLHANEPRFATAVALEDTEIIVLDREALESLIKKYPSIGIKILKGLNQILTIRLRKVVERLTAIF